MNLKVEDTEASLTKKGMKCIFIGNILKETLIMMGRVISQMLENGRDSRESFKNISFVLTI